MGNTRVIVTGSTSGLGKQIDSQLVSRGAEVVLACRDLQGGERAAAEIGIRFEQELL